ncbi:UPF0389 protein GA21628 [Belonocnema kinseyi]|uniref:UPF0389 protein GA21628 n=1 Tax=Belonocnema kinseyi TaxID=2817044 RepID=UPI00143CC4CA|nr:UPF0389 protein GA21628 [Belonocnema kinseyi]
MAGIRVQQKLLTNTFRNFHRGTIFREKKSTETLSTASKNVEPKKEEDTIKSPLGAVMYKTKTLDKYLLVWFKKYKSVADVPYQIREETMAHIHSKSRIRIANVLMVLGLLGCVWAVWSGKKEAASGDNVQKRILDKNKKLREDYLAKLEKSKST